ncbi:40S ribosomal protein S30 [Striga asiatica]|uniref:40S ribosomal protein S30 n=1 Tax=Striga asiatica TaxID=4170 RepID=A0A5A7NXY1_STRAF|nr:40S ribosomal protein S30 [Striga asiatica]
MGKVHGSLARAGKVRGQTPKVAKQDKKKKPRGRAHKRMQYNRRFVTADEFEDLVTCVRSRFRHKRRKPFLRDRPELGRKLLTKFFKGGPLYSCSTPSLSYSTRLSKLVATMGEVRCKLL